LKLSIAQCAAANGLVNSRQPRSLQTFVNLEPFVSDKQEPAAFQCVSSRRRLGTGSGRLGSEHRMHFADNFNPEWGHLAPAPSFMRTARVALVAAAVGAISGAGVVFSLIDRPAAEETWITARTFVPQSDVAFVATPSAAPLQAPHEIGTAANHATDRMASFQPGRVAESEADPGSTLHSSEQIAAASAPAAIAPIAPANEAANAADATPPQKKVVKRQPLPQQRLTWRAPEPAFSSGGTPLALLPNGNYPMRGQYSGAYQPRHDF
jgi:hypothetical protein